MNTPETTVPSEPAVASSDGLCVGDEITWTHCLHRGRSIGMTTRTAKIFQLTDKLAFVKFRGEVLNLRRENVRKKGQTTELTEYVMGMGKDT